MASISFLVRFSSIILERNLSLMLSPRALRTISELSNVLLLLTTTCAIGLSCVGLLSQAVRTAPNQSWKRNDDALIIGASYVVVVRFTNGYAK
jgi:hypothetical protein